MSTLAAELSPGKPRGRSSGCQGACGEGNRLEFGASHLWLRFWILALWELELDFNLIVTSLRLSLLLCGMGPIALSPRVA